MSELRIAVLGAAGRMGRTVVQLIAESPDCSLSGAWVRDTDVVAGKPTRQYSGLDDGVVATADLLSALDRADVAIDFTLPAAMPNVLDAIEASGVPLVSGTTGLCESITRRMRSVAERIPIVHDRNMSTGVHIMIELACQAAAMLGADCDIEILEAHHGRKIDAPSGTALQLAEAIAAARGVQLGDVAVFERHGEIGARPPGSIGFAVIRGGGIVGEHSVLCLSETERIEISHQALSRDVFAVGALRAARWLPGRKPGLYGMPDVLGISSGQALGGPMQHRRRMPP